MKYFFTLIIALSCLIPVHAAKAYIKGKIDQCEFPVGLLSYFRYYRDAPNIEGFRDKTFDIKKNAFRIEITDFTPGDIFILEIGYSNFKVILFDNDNLEVTISNCQNGNPEVKFTGRGSAKNNCFFIINNAKGNRDFRGLTIEEKKDIWHNDLIQFQSILDYAHFNKEIPDKQKFDSLTIHRLNTSREFLTIDKKEYDYLKRYILSHYYHNLLLDMEEFDESRVMQSLESFFEYSKIEGFLKSLSRIEFPIQGVLIYEFLKLRLKKDAIENDILPLEAFNNVMFTPDQICTEAESLLSGEILDVFYTGMIYNYLIQNAMYETDILLQMYKKVYSDKKYLNFLILQRNLIDSAITMSKPGIQFIDNALNDEGFNRITEKYAGKEWVLAIWSSRSIFDDNIYFNWLQEKYKDIPFVFICMDKQMNMNFWAFRVIDQNWTGNHYFYPVTDKSKVLHEMFYLDKESCPMPRAAIINKNGKIDGSSYLDFPYLIKILQTKEE